MSFSAGTMFGWLALSALLAGVVAFEITDDADLAPIVTAAPIGAADAGQDDVPLTEVAALSSDLIDDIVDRHLFSVSRRPFEPAAESESVAVNIPDRAVSLELIGTMLSGASRVVLLRHPSDGLLRFREGQTVEGWEIGDIGQNWVELRKGDEIERLELRTDLLQQRTSGQPIRAGQPVLKPEVRSNQDLGASAAEGTDIRTVSPAEN